MSVWGMIKELYSDVKDIAKEMKTCKNLARLLRKISAIIIVFVLFLQYWNILKFSSLEAAPRLSDMHREFLRNNITTSLWLWMIYSFFLGKILLRVVIEIESKVNKSILPIWFTIDDCIDFGLTIYFVFYSLNLLIEFSNGVNLNEYSDGAYIVAGLYLIIVFVRWVYYQNSNMWYKLRREYTQFYDSEGKRIPKYAYVIYYGKRHRVYLGRKSDGKNKCREWKISSDSDIFRDGIPLETAVKDKEGHLVLEKEDWLENNRK